MLVNREDVVYEIDLSIGQTFHGTATLDDRHDRIRTLG